jgi:hypothetical protein
LNAAINHLARLSTLENLLEKCCLNAPRPDREHPRLTIDLSFKKEIKEKRYIFFFA